MRILLLVLLTISSAHGGNLEEYIQRKNPNLSKKIVHEVSSELKKYPKAIRHIAEKESTFNPKAKNKHCVGLMGVNISVWFSSDPDYNLIRLGILRTKNEVYSITGNLKSGHYIWKRCKRNYKKYQGKE